MVFVVVGFFSLRKTTSDGTENFHLLVWVEKKQKLRSLIRLRSFESYSLVGKNYHKHFYVSNLIYQERKFKFDNDKVLVVSWKNQGRFEWVHLSGERSQ